MNKSHNIPLKSRLVLHRQSHYNMLLNFKKLTLNKVVGPVVHIAVEHVPRRRWKYISKDVGLSNVIYELDQWCMLLHQVDRRWAQTKVTENKNKLHLYILL